MSRPQFVLVAGPNGAGKSTLTASFKRRFPNLEVIDPDAIARDITGSFSTVDQAQLSAGRTTLALVDRHIRERQGFVVESTISGRTYLKYANAANDAGFRTVLIYLALSGAELSAERVAERVRLGGHGIPAADVQRRYPRSMANVEAHVQAFESAYIYDNSDDYQWVADCRGGMIHRVSPTAPAWIRPYIH